MNLEKLPNGLKKEQFDFEEIVKTINRADKDIESAKLLLSKGFDEVSYKIAYEAMLLAARALVYSYGYRPRVQGSHKIVVEFTKEVLGNEFAVLTKRFDRMRKKRHQLVYEAKSVSKTEAINAVDSAIVFIKEIKTTIQEKNPQQTLF